MLASGTCWVSCLIPPFPGKAAILPSRPPQGDGCRGARAPNPPSECHPELRSLSRPCETTWPGLTPSPAQTPALCLLMSPTSSSSSSLPSPRRPHPAGSSRPGALTSPCPAAGCVPSRPQTCLPADHTGLCPGPFLPRSLLSSRKLQLKIQPPGTQEVGTQSPRGGRGALWLEPLGAGMLSTAWGPRRILLPEPMSALSSFSVFKKGDNTNAQGPIKHYL